MLEKLIGLPVSLISARDKATWSQLKARVPSLPSSSTKGVFMPCDDCVRGGTGPGSHYTSNSENGELYVTHPYRQVTVARSDPATLARGHATYEARRNQHNNNWSQDPMDAALLGLVSEAVKLVLERANNGKHQI